MNLHCSGYEVDWQLPFDADVADDQRAVTGANRLDASGRHLRAESSSIPLAETSAAAVIEYPGNRSLLGAPHGVEALG